MLPLDQLADLDPLRLVGHVEPRGQVLPGRPAEPLGQVSAGLLVEVGQHHVGALLGEPLGHGPSQAAGGAGQNHHLVADPLFDLRHVVLTSVFPVV